MLSPSNDNLIDTFLKITSKFSASRNTIAEFVLEKAMEITQSHIAFLVFFDENEAIMNSHTWSRSILDSKENQKSLFAGICAEPIRIRAPFLKNKFKIKEFLKCDLPLDHTKINSILSVPIFDLEKIVAIITVGNKQIEYTETDSKFSQLLLQIAWRLIKNSDIEREFRAHKQIVKKTRILRRVLPICSACKKICNDHGKWETLEKYLLLNSEDLFTQEFCPECSEKYYPEIHEAFYFD